jgi:PQQ system protein
MANERCPSSSERHVRADSLRAPLHGNTISIGSQGGNPLSVTVKNRREGASVGDAAVDVSNLDQQNGVTLGRILGRGTVGHAEEDADGTMRATIRIPEDELVYEPGVLIMPHGGTLELELINDDKNTHCAVLPCNGDYKFIWLVNHSRGRATLELDGPGYYWYGSRSGNDEGRGLTAAIVVGGDTPEEARLDRPPQPRP